MTIARAAFAAAAAYMTIASGSASAAVVEAPMDQLVHRQSGLETGPMNREKTCLAEAVYNESGGESAKGRIAVAHVILNRTRSGTFPGSICGVVNQRGQFTYPRGRGIRKGGQQQWSEARAVASLAMQGFFSDVAGKAMFFHSVRVKPHWGGGIRQVTRIGAHVFYAQR